MGSPVLVSVANLVMEDVENRTLTAFDIKLPFWKRYVNDTCTVLPNNRVKDFNVVEDSIRFRVEVESDGHLPFLDILLCHETDGSVTCHEENRNQKKQTQ